MKFISKSANLHIILKPGIPAQPITGTPATPTLSVRFQDGVVDVKDEELITLMRNHSGYQSDFIDAVDESHDPYAGSRTPSEPAHILQEMKYGTPTKKTVGGKLGSLPPETVNMIKEQARELAKQMLPGMVKQTLTELVAAREAEKVSEDIPSPIEDETPSEDKEDAPKGKGKGGKGKK